MKDKGLEEIQKKLFFLTIFGIAMGALEAIAIVYLRKISTLEGNAFYRRPVFLSLSFESIREISTIVMLLMVGVIAGRNFLQRCSCFLYVFGVWDIVYYLGLKMLIGWPESLLTWDNLFYLPVLWQGPVLAPLVCSLLMILFSIEMIYLQERGYPINERKIGFLVMGGLSLFFSFIWNSVYHTSEYPWSLFGTGTACVFGVELTWWLESKFRIKN